MGLTFKSAIEQENKYVFLNPNEFGEVHEINGKEMPVIIDDNELLERDKAHLLNAELDADLYRVKSATEEAGIYAIEIEAVRT